LQFALVFTPVLFFIPVLAFLGPVLFRLSRRCQPSELTVEWYESFDVSSYRPMQGLLAPDDFQFLSRQPGFDPSLFSKLRRERIRIFRQYLNRLILDFNRLYSMTLLVISQGSEDRSDLVGKLISLRFHFWVAILRVEISYLICRFSARPVAVSNLLRHLEDMHFELGRLPQARSLFSC
jgi:hypothetical protein